MSDEEKSQRHASVAREHARRGFAGLARLVGRRYPALEKFVETVTDPEVGLDLMRLARDMESEIAKERRHAREPWRR